MIGGNINYNFDDDIWNGNNSYSRFEALALNMLNIATTTGSTESYNNDKIWYDKNEYQSDDKSKNKYYTYNGLISNIVGKADIMKCIKLKNAAIVLLAAVNDRFKQDAIHESRRGTLESGHNNYAIELSNFYSALDSALSSRVAILMNAKMIERNSSKRKCAFGNKKKQRTRTKSKKKSRMGRSPHKSKKKSRMGRSPHKSKKKSRNKRSPHKLKKKSRNK